MSNLRDLLTIRYTYPVKGIDWDESVPQNLHVRWITFKSARESYGDAAIGYVCLRREGTLCTVKGEICPEHRVRSKSYDVSVIVDEKENVIQDVKCHDCAASSEVECYWKKSALSTIGTTKKVITTKELCDTRSAAESSCCLPDNFFFLQTVLETAKEKKLLSALTRHNYTLPDNLTSLSIHQLLIAFLDLGASSAVDDFLAFASTQMENTYEQAQLRTKDQKDNSLWYELRYGRITASKMYKAAHCFLEKKVNAKFRKCGLLLSPKFPILGASPDAISNEFVVEVKCPSSPKTEKDFLPGGKVNSKCMAQINLQMFLAHKKKRFVLCRRSKV
ncbi:hypothetical protein ALC62_09108 [Cyphomyrmex costatus]|uniref:YqaJ viral recombinase domain-containing protein n=1 Tax=Cyphomyrmex costatus TaxID=456900 RepID=A0A151IFX9_9HYME|nr:hypothetical protein ALC62_09108 [Cyphomyrmex costatus]